MADSSFFGNIASNLNKTDENGVPAWATALNKTGAALQGTTAEPLKGPAKKDKTPVPTEAPTPPPVPIGAAAPVVATPQVPPLGQAAPAVAQ